MLKLNSYLVLFLITLKYNVLQCSAWSGFENIGGAAKHVAISSWGAARRDVFAAAANGAIYQQPFESYKWAGSYGKNGGNTALKPSAYAMKADTSFYDVLYTGPDNLLYRMSWNGNKFSIAASTNGGALKSGPAVAAVDSTYLHVFALGLNDQMYHCVVNVDNNHWENWESLGAKTLVGDPAATSLPDNRFDLFALGKDTIIPKVYQKTYSGGWGEWTALPLEVGFHPAGLGAAAIAYHPDTYTLYNYISLFMRDYTDDSLWHIRSTDNEWGALENLGGKIISSPAAVAIVNSVVDVYVVGVDEKVYHKSWDLISVDSPDGYFGCSGSHRCWYSCEKANPVQEKRVTWCYSTMGEQYTGAYMPCENYKQCQGSAGTLRCASACTL